MGWAYFVLGSFYEKLHPVFLLQAWSTSHKAAQSPLQRIDVDSDNQVDFSQHLKS